MRRQSDFSASESQGVSTRTWSYLGALLVGFSLAAMADFDTLETTAEPPAAQHNLPSPGDEAAAPVTRTASTTPDRSHLRAVSAVSLERDPTPRVVTRAP